MRKISIFLFLLAFILPVISQVKYSPAWFGPNANPVPEFTDGLIPAKTTVSLMGDYYFGFGDETKTATLK